LQSETVVVAFGDAPHAALVAEPSGDVQILWADPGSPLDPVVLRGRDVILYAASGSVEEFAARARDLLAASPGESATLVLGRALGRAEGPQEWSRSFAGFELVAVGESPAGFKVELAEATGSRTPTGGVLRLLVGMLEARSAPTPKAVDRGDEELPRGPAGVDVKQVARPGPQRGTAQSFAPIATAPANQTTSFLRQQIRKSGSTVRIPHARSA